MLSINENARRLMECLQNDFGMVLRANNPTSGGSENYTLDVADSHIVGADGPKFSVHKMSDIDGSEAASVVI